MIRAVLDVEGVLQLENLAALPGVKHGFATRRGRIEAALPSPITRLRQVHGAEALMLPDAEPARAPYLAVALDDRPAADALFTDARNVAVTVAVADCVPVLFADPARGAIAAAHAGWRGLAGGVVENTLAAMQAAYGCDPADIVVGIGPCIGPCCFEVGNEVIDAFSHRGYGNAATVPHDGGNRPYCNLVAVVLEILGNAGITADHTADTGLCTMCNSDWLWSYRVDGKHAGRMVCGLSQGFSA